ncbi:hypothetical protein [Leifsonia sp. AG29]|uniref:hypothetical protein n=1 Tax=Leifsonia sp. AG29 TaxID=2598860 RepID=UPI00131D9FE8|nr:hypothetical protein [Leifsonia sp. AG29]
MTDTTAKPVRWWRRTPPPELQNFPRAIWWAGHGQLFIGAAFAVTGIILLFCGDGRWQWGLLLIAMALPFATSGRMLRAQALRQATLTGRSWSARIAELIVVVLGIATLSIAFVAIDVWLFFSTLGLIINYSMR